MARAWMQYCFISRCYYLLFVYLIKLLAGILLCNALLLHRAQAMESTITLGTWLDDENDLFGGRLALRTPWPDRWFQGPQWGLGFFWDIGLGYWHSNSNREGATDSLFIVSAGFMLQVRNMRGLWGLKPFIEAGIGPALLITTNFGNYELSTSYQFEDRLGVGFAFGARQQYQLAYRYLHYSNAGIKLPNQGIDINTLNFTWQW